MFCNWKVGPVRYDCMDIGGPCYVGAGQCYLGLICGATKTCQMGIGGHCDMRVTGQCSPDLACVYGLCQLKADDPNAHAASLLLTTSLTGTTTKRGPSFILVVVGLLGAAMMALKVGQRRHRGLLRRNRNQYSEVDANPIEV